MNYEKFASDANAIESAIKSNVTLKSVVADADYTVVEEGGEDVSPYVKNVLDTPWGDKKETVLKKAIAAAMVVAQANGEMADLPRSGAAIAAIVDEGLARVKAGYQVGIGKIYPDEAINYIVDRAEARAVTFVDKVFDSGMVSEVVTEGVVRLAYAIPEIGPIVGPIAENYKPIIKSVIRKVEQPVRNFIKDGIHTVANTAKKAMDSIVKKATNTIKKIALLFA